MAKGDYVKVYLLDQNGLFAVQADKGGRKVEYGFSSEGKVNWLQATLQTRGGTVLKRIQVPADQVAAMEVLIKGEE